MRVDVPMSLYYETNNTKEQIMGRLLFVLVLIAAGVVGLGFYRHWFELSSSSGDDKTQIELKVDKKKIQEDEKKAENTVRGTKDK